MDKSNDERMGIIETEIKNINKSLDTHADDQRKDFDLMFKKLDALNGKYAGKWVEKVSIGVLITTIAGITLFTIKIIVGG